MDHDISQMKETLAALTREKEALALKSRNLANELSNMTKAQGNLYRFQERVERQKTIYAQIAEIGHKFNQTLDLTVVIEAIERFIVDHLNFERCALVIFEDDSTVSRVRSCAGYYSEQKVKALQVELSRDAEILQGLKVAPSRLVILPASYITRDASLAKTFGLDEALVYSLGLNAAGNLRGFLIVGNSEAHFDFHLRVEDEEEMHALFANITSQIVASMNAVRFMEAIQSESEQVKRLLNNMKQAVFSVDSNGLIVEPVSKFTREIFADDVERKSVFDTIYRSIPTDSEDYSRARTVFHTVFGEPDFQWELMNHDLPSRIEYRAPGSGADDSLFEGDPDKGELVANKILKAAYTPIFDEDGNLEKLMYVIEDVTELEKLESQIEEKQAGLRIITQIAENDRATIGESFFAPTHTMLNQCFQLLEKFAESNSVFGDLMRNLHTIKGNSRIFGFSSISTAVHQAEAKVLEAKERGTNELSIARAEIRASLNSVHKVLDQYGEVAYRVFGIGNPFVFKPNEANGSEFHSGAGTVALEISQDKIKSLKSLVAEAENGKASLAEIKRAVSRLSETPVGPAFSKFQAMVKEVSGNLGKSAQLIIIDDGVELDREVVNQLRDVLTHLLRNAIDHGLEIIEKRKSSGKSEMGTIRIHCREEGGDVIVKLEDDGKGIDGDEIARAAVRKGLRTDTEIQKLSQEEKIDLIFLPGLSSKEIVTEISGRGVGMDFVKDAIAQMSAQISIDTKVGRGTNFTIRFKRERLGVIHA